MGTSLIEQDNQFFETARQNINTRLKARAPKTITARILCDLVCHQTEKVDKGHVGYAVSTFLKEGFLRFEDFGFKKRDLEHFHKYGRLSKQMFEVFDTIPNVVDKVFHTFEDRKYWLERREYEKLRGPYGSGRPALEKRAYGALFTCLVEFRSS